MSKSEKRLVPLNRLIFVLSILGVATATYVLQGWLRKAVIICPTGGCEAVSKNAVSYPLGIPVPAIGLAGYSFLAILAFLRSLSINHELKTKLLTAMLGMAIFGVCFVTWFTYLEFFVIRLSARGALCQL